MNWARSWRKCARHYRALLGMDQSSRELFWRTLASASPRVEQSKLLDATEHERATLLVLLHGLRTDLDFLIDEGLASPVGLKMLRHMVKRVREL